MKKLLCALCFAATFSAAVDVGADMAGAVGQTQGVTSTSITIGVPYIDLATVDKLYGLHLNQGSYPDAYNALIDNLNAHGGINGRTIIAKYAPVNPAVPTSGATSCTQLVQDNHVFVALNPYFGICFLEAGVPTNGGHHLVEGPHRLVHDLADRKNLAIRPAPWPPNAKPASRSPSK